MNILIISNGAPNYHRFFNGIAQLLVAEGHHVEVAVDCPYSYESNQLDAIGLQVHDFSDHFRRAVEEPAMLQRYAEFNLNAAILSDFERAEVYKIGSNRDSAYYRRLQAALLGFYESIILSGSIDLVLYENVSNAFVHNAWIVCQKLKVAYCGLVGSRLPGRYAIVSDPHAEHLNYQPTVEAIRSGSVTIPDDVRAWCGEYLRNLENIVPDYMKFNNLDNLQLTGRYVNAAKFSKLSRVLRHLRDDHHHAFQIGNPLSLSWQMVWRNARRKLKLPFCRRYYSSPLMGEKYLFYPLHFHPESSTSILAGTYLDEYEVIRNIAFNLPVGMSLYVKDHVSAFAYPSIAFYRKLAALPNVRVLSPFENTKQLLRGCEAVITLTSTVGYEALLLNKRVFLYGSVFYEFHPNVVRIENPTRLFELLSAHLAAPLPVGADYNNSFLASYYMNTYPGVLNFFLNEGMTQVLLDQVYPTLRGVLIERADAARLLRGIPLLKEAA